MTLDEIKRYLERLEGWDMKYQAREAGKLREICWELVSRLEDGMTADERSRWFR